ncbi:oligosaccharide flippase family protein [Shewanella sp. 10N.286.48.A6]|uniref:oligosaccharide flippase family protein n=1 Tax=Shewanella sp. 10N.286.48.A6 TaxID=1880833 RepID=UPI000C85B464
MPKWMTTWAIVSQTVITAIVTVVLLWYRIAWRPIESFDQFRLLQMLEYSWKLLVSSLIDVIFRNGIVLIIGKLYSPADVGYYSQVQKLSELPAITFTSALKNANFPILSQASESEISKKFLDTVIISSLVFVPLCTFIFVNSREIVKLLLGEAWSSVSIFLSILICGYILLPLQSLNLNILQVKGRSDLFLKLEVFKKIFLSC